MQYIEYKNGVTRIGWGARKVLSMSDGVYGSTFYILTGLHGAHIIVGTIYLIVGRMRIKEVTKEHHVVSS